MKRYAARLKYLGLLFALGTLAMFLSSLAIVTANERPLIVSRWLTTTPVIDGVISNAEWQDATRIDISSGGKEAYAYFKNDGNWLYVAIDAVFNEAYQSDPVLPWDEVRIFFDAGNDGNLRFDWRLIFGAPTRKGEAAALRILGACSFTGVEGGLGAVNDTAGHVQYELKIPLYVNMAPLVGGPGSTTGMLIAVNDRCGFGGCRDVLLYPGDANADYTCGDDQEVVQTWALLRLSKPVVQSGCYAITYDAHLDDRYDMEPGCTYYEGDYDIHAVGATCDDAYLYFLWEIGGTVGQPSDANFIFWASLDVDDNTSTGWIGAEYLAHFAMQNGDLRDDLSGLFDTAKREWPHPQLYRLTEDDYCMRGSYIEIRVPKSYIRSYDSTDIKVWMGVDVNALEPPPICMDEVKAFYIPAGCAIPPTTPTSTPPPTPTYTPTPTSTPTPTPTPTATSTPTPTPTPIPGVYGKVYVRVGNKDYPLRNVRVSLCDSFKCDMTNTDKDGKYAFKKSLDGQFTVEALLGHGSKDTHYFQVRYKKGGSRVWVRTRPFTIRPGEAKTVNIDFANQNLDSSVDPKDRLDELALIYFYVKQAFDFMDSKLKHVPTYNMPLKVYGYSTACSPPDRSCYERDKTNANVHISVDDSQYIATDPSVVRHEVFHHLMQDAITIPPLPEGDTNHGGYANSSTSDSWVEGWAEFWPVVLNHHVNPTDPYPYVYRTGVSFEQNWKAWDTETGSGGRKIYREDFAVASLLWDLYDDRFYQHLDCGIRMWKCRDTEYCDFVHLTTFQIWQVIGMTNTLQLRDMKDVYDALVRNDVGQEDFDDDGMNDLDELFVLHGFFADTNDNCIYDPDEEIGRAADGARPSRRSPPRVPGAYLKLNFRDPDGRPVGDNTLYIEVIYPSPHEYFSYAYQIEVPQATGALVYLELPPESVPCSVHVHPKNGRPSTDLTMSNADYWQAVQTSTTGYAIEHTFIVEHKALIYLPLIRRHSE